MKKMRMVSGLMAGCMVVSALAGCGMGRKDASGRNGAGESGTEYAADGAESPKAEENFVVFDMESPQEWETEEYSAVRENGFVRVTNQPLSTFAADVDTASYSNVRRMLQQGGTPEEIPQGAVRLEEMVNYFRYDYRLPGQDEVFGVTIDGTDCPWQPEHGLIRVGIRTGEIDFGETPGTNLVFLLDVSGSMEDPDKLPLVKQAFGMLTDSLGEKDRISVVTYASGDEVVLEGARGDQKDEIMEAIQCLEAGGGTNGSDGIETAYAIAERYFVEGGINRVILATDGDLNIGTTSESGLKTLIEEKKRGGVYLSVLGFGQGNLKDNKMEALADYGNGNYGYIDSLMEARRMLVEQMGSTLVTVAEDVKLQMEFNPAWISSYRLLGYENRLMSAEEFRDDAKDAGELGAGHRVTALYEVVWAGSADAEEDGLKYQTVTPAEGETGKEWGTFRIRYKDPGAETARELEYAFGKEIYRKDLREAGMLLSSSVAEFAMVLKDSENKGNSSYDHLMSLWEGIDYEANQEVAHFLELVKLAARQSVSGAGEMPVPEDRPEEIPYF